MKNFHQSLLFWVVPGVFLGLAMGICSAIWTLPWWARIAVGIGGYFVGLCLVTVLAMLIGTDARGRRGAH